MNAPLYKGWVWIRNVIVIFVVVMAIACFLDNSVFAGVLFLIIGGGIIFWVNSKIKKPQSIIQEEEVYNTEKIKEKARLDAKKEHKERESGSKDIAKGLGKMVKQFK